MPLSLARWASSSPTFLATSDFLRPAPSTSTDRAAATLVAARSVEVEGAGLKKSEVAKKVGELLAQRAKDKGIERVVFDRSGYLYHGRVKALAEGAREGGLVF